MFDILNDDEIDEALRQMVADGSAEIMQHIPELKWRLTEKGLKEAAELIKRMEREEAGIDG